MHHHPENYFEGCIGSAPVHENAHALGSTGSQKSLMLLRIIAMCIP